VSADKLKDRFNDFLKDHPQAKEARPDDAVSEARR
jgi:hypothetical protein